MRTSATHKSKPNENALSTSVEEANSRRRDTGLWTPLLNITKGMNT